MYPLDYPRTLSQKRDSPGIILYMFWIDIRFLNEKIYLINMQNNQLKIRGYFHFISDPHG